MHETGPRPRKDRGHPPIRVVVVDDQLVFRLVVRRLVAATPGFEYVGDAESGAEALPVVRALRPDLALVDVRMPGMDGFETARRLTDIAPDLVVVLISIDSAIRLDAPSAYPGVAAHIRKADLSTRTLRELWAKLAAADRP